MKLVSKVELIDVDQEVFDLGIEDTHCYYVLPPEGDSTVLVHNCHYGAAPQSVKVLAQLKARYRIGLTGTPDRKDGRYLLVNSVLGPVVHRTAAVAMRPRVVPLETDLSFDIRGSGPGAFTYYRKQMERSKTRREIIVAKAINLAKQGHFVIIPLSFTASIDAYVKMINEEAEENWAKAFDGRMKKEMRRKLIVDARRYRFRILVANIALISTGVNIPRASCIIDGVTPTSNLPKARQRFSRILTPMTGKPEPLIVYVMDGGAARGMRRNEFWNCLVKEFSPIIKAEHYTQFKDYFNTRPGSQFSKKDI